MAKDCEHLHDGLSSGTAIPKCPKSSTEEGHKGSPNSNPTHDDATLMIDTLKNVATKSDIVKYRLLWQTLQDVHTNVADRERVFSEREKSLQNGFLDHKVSVEKKIFQENENVETLENLDEEKEKVQLELDRAERLETIATYEQGRLEERNHELKLKKKKAKAENAELVQPEMERLEEELRSLKEEKNDIIYRKEKETRHIKEIEVTIQSLEDDFSGSTTRIKEKRVSEERLSNELNRARKHSESINKAIYAIKIEVKKLEEEANTRDSAVINIKAKRRDVKDEKADFDTKLDKQRILVEHQQGEVASVKKFLDLERAKSYALTTNRLELEVSLKEINESIRHGSTIATLEKKQLEISKRSYIKKRQAADKTKNIVPQLETKLQEHEDVFLTFGEEHTERQKGIDNIKQEVDLGILHLVKRENVEKEMRDEVDELVEEVDENEAEIDRWHAEERKFSKIISIMKAQSEVKKRKATHIAQNKADVVDQIKLKKLFVMDLGKTCNETNKRIKEIGALYETVENERNEYRAMIHASDKALKDLKIRIETMQNEMEKLRTDSKEKIAILAKECDAHENSQSNRAILRAERNNTRMLYRGKRDEVERQSVQIDKLNSSVSSLQRDRVRLKTRNESMSHTKKVMADQLEGRKKELLLLYQRANFYENALKHGETTIQRRKEDIRMLELQSAEIQRHTETIKRNLPNTQVHSERIKRLEKDLNTERSKTQQLSEHLEDPNNLDRWRELGVLGTQNDLDEDSVLDEEHLLARTTVLEHRLSNNREILMKKEMLLEEVTGLANDLCKRAAYERNGAQPLVRKLNECRSKVQNITRSMMALVSELSMYQATALKLEEEKTQQEHAMEELKMAIENGEIPSDEVAEEDIQLGDQDRKENYHPAKHALRTKAEPRPTAYIPDDNIGLPKPFGSMAPFKPTEAGTTMRHIRPPKI